MALEDIFTNQQIVQEVRLTGLRVYWTANAEQPQWYTLKSRQKSAKSKGSAISGEVQLQFAIADPANPSAIPQDLFDRFIDMISMSTPTPGADEDEESKGLKMSSRGSDGYNDDDEDDEEDEKDLETSDETDDPVKAGGTEKRKKKLRLARLKKKTKARAYEFSGGTDVVGIVFLDIVKITDLPPERNSRCPSVLHGMSC